LRRYISRTDKNFAHPLRTSIWKKRDQKELLSYFYCPNDNLPNLNQLQGLRDRSSTGAKDVKAIDSPIVFSPWWTQASWVKLKTGTGAAPSIPNYDTSTPSPEGFLSKRLIGEIRGFC